MLYIYAIKYGGAWGFPLTGEGYAVSSVFGGVAYPKINAALIGPMGYICNTTISDDRKTISWFSTRSGDYQLNGSGNIYYYMVIS